jgi:hypothetical protein
MFASLAFGLVPIYRRCIGTCRISSDANDSSIMLKAIIRWHAALALYTLICVTLLSYQMQLNACSYAAMIFIRMFAFFAELTQSS